MRMNDELAGLVEQRRLLAEELVYHHHLDDDAQRDASLGDAEDRALAYETNRDRLRFERLVREADQAITRVEERRQRLLAKLGDL